MYGPGFDLLKDLANLEKIQGNFDGTESTAVDHAFSHPVDGDFTIEGEIFMEDPGSAEYKPVISRTTTGTDNKFCQFDLQVQAGGNINFFMGNGDSDVNGGYGILLNGGNLEPSTWTSVKVTKVGG